MVHAFEFGAGHEVRGVMVGSATQENEEITERVRPFEAEQFLIEFLERVQARREGRDVAKLGRAQHRRPGATGLLGCHQVHRCAGGGLRQHEHVRRARADIGSPFHLISRVTKTALGVVQRF
jgi:hypothetical protein